jgi:hypothetical protein
MSTLPVNFHEVIRFYERVNRLTPASFTDRGQNTSSDLLNISAEAKRRFVLKQARSEVLEKIKR